MEAIKVFKLARNRCWFQFTIQAECNARLKANPDAGSVRKRVFPKLHEEVINKIRASQVKPEENSSAKQPVKSPKKEENIAETKQEPLDMKQEAMEAETDVAENGPENLRKGQGKLPVGNGL